MELNSFALPDADAICQAIFAGTVALGRPDPFLARELADVSRAIRAFTIEP